MHHQESSTMSQNNNGSVSLQAHWLKFRWTKYFNRFSNKLRFIILITALIMSIILFIISCFVVKHYLIIEAYDNLQTLGQLKQTQIDNYLQQLKGQLILASRDAVVKEAMIEFADAFSSIESGSYELPEYEDLY
jgi:hypothetical protein